jgi:uncharacterized iron-regulated protein
MRYLLSIFLIFIAFSSFKPKLSYQIYAGDKAKAIDFDKMMKGLAEADVVFFGEDHNNSICHWLQLQVLRDLGNATSKNVIVGAEMFEADAQLVLNEYLAGLIKPEHLEKEGKVWSNYKTDYAPMVDLAKESNWPFIATNVPRRYANIVARNGLEGLDAIDEGGRQYIVPLPIEVDYELPGYKEIAEMMAGHMGAGGGSKNMVDAQAIKDATMAYFIGKNWSPGSVFYHLNGSFHSRNHEGIVYFLKKAQPELRVVTITVVDQKEIDELAEENHNLADYVIAIPEDMTKTY